MSARKKIISTLIIVAIALLPIFAFSKDTPTSCKMPPYAWAYETIAQQLGWVSSNTTICGGYYLEPPFLFPIKTEKSNTVEITSNHGLVSQHGTSFLEEEVTVTRTGQQITSNKAFVYRNTKGKLSAIDMIGDVHLREPNTLIVAKKGRYNFTTQNKTLMDILYRTVLLTNKHAIAGPNVPIEQTQIKRKITALTAWGEAHEFTQTEPRIYEFYSASFSTCPPINPAWRLKGSHIVLNKNTGRGYATHARLYIKDIPIFYFPYFNFSIDSQRKTGFLKPTIGSSNQWGPYLLTPFYWNMAPNYDMTITPGILTKRGVQFSDHFRYLSKTSQGHVNVSILPDDSEFVIFKETMLEQNKNSTNPITQAELNRLLSSSNTRKSFYLRDNSQFDQHLSTKIDFNYVSDDYYLTNLGSDLNEVTKNYLLQEADLFYKTENWDFTGRLQAYQTLHPIDQPSVNNQYRRLPQFILNGDYPDQALGFEYFIYNEATQFTFLKTPGSNLELPVGDRLHTQPGISLPIFRPYFFINPRAQLALTAYYLHHTQPTDTPSTIHRAIPILDLSSGLAFSRTVSLFHHAYQQTLDPQIYYLYIPYRNQSSIPIFDTTVNTLTYDQLFNYNRFTGIDRIGDANQLSYGLTTRFIDQQSGLEKIRFGVGEIVYFANRLVTLCNVNSPISCTDNPDNHSNYQRFSSVSGILNYYINPLWSFTSNAIWNPATKQLDNTTLNFHYQQNYDYIFNFGYTYARGGDIMSGIQTTDPRNNLKVTDLSFAWKLFRDVQALGRWSQNWNHKRLQNLLFGLEYDTCCWAVRAVGGRAFLNVDPNNNYRPNYDNEYYIQFAFKGLGNVGRETSGPLSNITGYNPQFGQEF